MAYGSFQHTIDKKGRIAIPSKLRENLGNEFIICCDIFGNACLNLYSNEEWENFVAKIEALPNSKAGPIKRFLFNSTFSAELDTQGRLLIPSKLRELINLENEGHIIAMKDRIEIWNSDKWVDEEKQYTPEYMRNITAELEL